MTRATRHPLAPPPLEEVAAVLSTAFRSNYKNASASVVDCPDLRNAPFHLAAEGLCGNEVAADIGGQANLFPQPHPEKHWSLIECAKLMEMSPSKGAVIGAGAGPAHLDGMPSELAPHFSWQGGFENVTNLSRVTRIVKDANNERAVRCVKSESTEFALMMNLFGSDGLSGHVIKISAKGRTGDAGSITILMQEALKKAYGDDQQISLGGVFVVKRGKAKYHVMPPFPPANELPFKNRAAVESWLTYHDFGAPMVCLSLLHSADPQNLGIRMEHTHCFSNDKDEGGHYHYDIPEGDESGEVEYEGYFNTIKTFFQIDYPSTE